MTKTNKTPKTSPKPCECSKWEFGTTIDLAGGDVDFEGTTTGCKEMTHRIFAQGHDAKLVGYLVRGELAGMELRKGEGVVHTWGDAVLAAGSVSDALAAKAALMLEAGRRRAAKKAVKSLSRKVTKDEARADAEARMEAPLAPVTRAAKVKIGRWTYDAVIGADTGDAVYKTKLGAVKAAPIGTYTEVN